MTARRRALLLLVALLAASPAAALVHHDIAVALRPGDRALSATDTITLQDGASADGTVTFALHGGLNPASPTPGVRLELVSKREGGTAAETWRASLPPGVLRFAVSYAGTIDHPLSQVGEEYARGQKETVGTITPDGVFLGRAALWYPETGDATVTFSAEISLPAGWDAVAPGDRTGHDRGGSATTVRWEATEPVDEIMLAAGAWTAYERKVGGATVMVFLRTPDEALAGKYLDHSARYLAMYGALIGPYPYGKFAVAENFWETGYGMPSFTLLGPTVLRLPFILTSSLPHEILHSWWGNAVMVDYGTGNWAEGLTAYLSDHLMKEQQGTAAEYRETTLQKYADYVTSGRDLPLTDFRSRHGSVTEAVGYGKSMMLFQMLRLDLGDPLFTEGLRKLYAGFRFKAASWDDLRGAFEAASGRDLRGFFRQWTTRPGAPELRIASASASPADGGWRLDLAVEQAQEGDPFELRIPVAVTLEGKPAARMESLPMTGRRAGLRATLPARPLRIDLDPGFDLFRRLDRREIPPALTQAFGAERPVIVLPSQAPEALLAAYKTLAASLAGTGPGAAEIVADDALAAIPDDRSAWVLGWENRHYAALAPALAEAGAGIGPSSVKLEKEEIPRAGHAFVISARHPTNESLAVLFIAMDDPAAAEGLGRKLPHYQKYGYLAFEGAEPANVAKGRWMVTGSPMTASLLPADQPTPTAGASPPRQPLAALPETFSKEKMMETVRALATAESGERMVGAAGEAAAAFIAGRFLAIGLHPGADGGPGNGYLQAVDDGQAGASNVLGLLPGSRSPGETLVVGAHYDGVDGNRPGADDNASGVAVLVELARVLAAGPPPDRTILFVAFAGEEAGRIGSKSFLSRVPQRSDTRYTAMVNLDTVGRLGKGKLLVLGGSSAKEWVHILRGAGYLAGVETAMVTEELDASDDASFREAGIPAIQLFTGPHADYHRPSDTPDKIDTDGLVKVASVAKEVIEYLAGKGAKLTPPGTASGPGSAASGPPGERKVSLGTIPDFAFAGPGVKLSGVVPGSPAEKAGLREGDVAIALDGAKVADLKSLSAALKGKSAGDRLKVTYRRGEVETTVEVMLEVR
jgi:hypothetical protein